MEDSSDLKMDFVDSLDNNNESEATCNKSQVVDCEENKPQKPKEAESDSKVHLDGDEFAYTKTERFTSEIFKIEVGNLPRFFSYGECKKLLTRKLKLKPHKINVVKHINKAYVTFKNEEDKKEALAKLSKYQYKSKELEVKNAKPKADVMSMKRRLPDEDGDSPASKLTKVDALSSEELLKNIVIPWWDKPYEQQLEEKYKKMCESLTDLRKKICTINNIDKQVFRWLMQQKKESGLCCPTKSILPSPVTTGYRNKNGFTVGRNINGEVDVGFRLGKYRQQRCAVEPPTCLIHVSDQMKKIAASFADYVRNSKLCVYDRQTHTGHWKQLALRSTRSNMVMATIALSKQNVTDEKLAEEQEAVKNHFKSSEIHVDSLLFRICTDESISSIEATPAIAYDGEGVIHENLFDLKFRISPNAFFQCNTLAAEVLYDCVKNMVMKKVVNKTEFTENENNKKVILLDVCCGTGTIGLCLANSVSEVIGIDICKEAIEDAKINAELNGITNAEFYCNKAEDALPEIIRKLSRKDVEIVAVVDPPRCGLHQTVVKTIRHCGLIKKLVYVSCSIDQAKQNFISLCRPASKRLLGLPFMPILAQPIDLFPHTAHCELVMLMERIVPEPPSQNAGTTDSATENTKITPETPSSPPPSQNAGTTDSATENTKITPETPSSPPPSQNAGTTDSATENTKITPETPSSPPPSQNAGTTDSTTENTKIIPETPSSPPPSQNAGTTDSATENTKITPETPSSPPPSQNAGTTDSATELATQNAKLSESNCVQKPNESATAEGI